MTIEADTTLDNTPDFTEAEAAAIEAGKADDIAAAAAEAKAAAAAPAAAAVEPEPAAPTPDPVAVAIAEQAAATRALAESVAAQRQPEPTAPAAAAEQPRDYDAELSAAEAAFAEAEQKYDDGDLDKAEFDKAKAAFRATERAIVREQAAADAADRLRKESAEAEAQRAKAAEDRAEIDWKAAQTKFFADPGNAKLVEGNIKTAAFTAAVQEAFAEGAGALSYDEVLVKAREKITGIPAVDTADAIKKAKFERNRDAAPAAQTLRDVPASGNDDNAPGSSLDNLGISELEDAMFRMSDADRARYLADAPGGLRDNPRATN